MIRDPESPSVDVADALYHVWRAGINIDGKVGDYGKDVSEEVMLYNSLGIPKKYMVSTGMMGIGGGNEREW